MLRIFSRIYSNRQFAGGQTSPFVYIRKSTTEKLLASLSLEALLKMRTLPSLTLKSQICRKKNTSTKIDQSSWKREIISIVSFHCKKKIGIFYNNFIGTHCRIYLELIPMFILVIYKYSIYGFELLDMMCFQVLPKCYDTGPSEQGDRGGYLSPLPDFGWYVNQAGRLYPPQDYLPPIRIFRLSYGPATWTEQWSLEGLKIRIGSK